MEFVEINADSRSYKPRLTGGRRGNATLLPGGNAVSDNLVPSTMLPASAGSLADVFSNLKKPISSPTELMNVGKALKGKGRKCGGATLGEILQHPSDHQTAFDLILKGAKKGGKRGRPKKGGAMVMNQDGSFTSVGSDDMSWMRMPKKGGAYLGPDGKVVVTAKKGKLGASNPGLFHHKTIPSGGLVHHSKGYIPRHGHGANTSIGTNYQLSQFGGSMSHPIGNTSSYLSPALSGMSVGAGRSCLPKGKNLRKLLKFMSDSKKHLHGMKGGDLMGDAWDSIKHIGHELYKEYGSQIFDKGKDLLVDELKKHAHNYITGGSLSGGDFWGDVWDGIKAVASGIWNALQIVLNDDVVKEVEREVLHMGVKMAGDYAQQQMKQGMSGSSGSTPVGAGRPGANGHGINPGFHGYGRPGADGHGIRKLGGMMVPDDYTNKMMSDYMKEVSGKGRPGADGHGIRKIGGDKFMDDLYNKLPQNLKDMARVRYTDGTTPEERKKHPKGSIGVPIGIYKGGKKPSARGAIVSKIMKEKGLSLPMASKYVKEHGLY